MARQAEERVAGSRRLSTITEVDYLIGQRSDHEDEWHATAWERALDLAEASGIDTPARQLTDV